MVLRMANGAQVSVPEHVGAADAMVQLAHSMRYSESNDLFDLVGLTRQRKTLAVLSGVGCHPLLARRTSGVHIGDASFGP